MYLGWRARLDALRSLPLSHRLGIMTASQSGLMAGLGFAAGGLAWKLLAGGGGVAVLALPVFQFGERIGARRQARAAGAFFSVHRPQRDLVRLSRI